MLATTNTGTYPIPLPQPNANATLTSSKSAKAIPLALSLALKLPVGLAVAPPLALDGSSLMLGACGGSPGLMSGTILSLLSIANAASLVVRGAVIGGDIFVASPAA